MQVIGYTIKKVLRCHSREGNDTQNLASSESFQHHGQQGPGEGAGVQIQGVRASARIAS